MRPPTGWWLVYDIAYTFAVGFTCGAVWAVWLRDRTRGPGR